MFHKSGFFFLHDHGYMIPDLESCIQYKMIKRPR